MNSIILRKRPWKNQGCSTRVQRSCGRPHDRHKTDAAITTAFAFASSHVLGLQQQSHLYTDRISQSNEALSFGLDNIDELFNFCDGLTGGGKWTERIKRFSGWNLVKSSKALKRLRNCFHIRRRKETEQEAVEVVPHRTTTPAAEVNEGLDPTVLSRPIDNPKPLKKNKQKALLARVKSVKYDLNKKDRRSLEAFLSAIEEIPELTDRHFQELKDLEPEIEQRVRAMNFCFITHKEWCHNHAKGYMTSPKYAIHTWATQLLDQNNAATENMSSLNAEKAKSGALACILLLQNSFRTLTTQASEIVKNFGAEETTEL